MCAGVNSKGINIIMLVACITHLYFLPPPLSLSSTPSSSSACGHSSCFFHLYLSFLLFSASPMVSMESPIQALSGSRAAWLFQGCIIVCHLCPGTRTSGWDTTALRVQLCTWLIDFESVTDLLGLQSALQRSYCQSSTHGLLAGWFWIYFFPKAELMGPSGYPHSKHSISGAAFIWADFGWE